MAKYCSNCGRKIEEDIKYCPDCGWELDNNEYRKRNNETNNAKGSNVFAILGFIFSFISPLLGLILSIIGLSQLKKYKKYGIVFGILGIIISIIRILINILIGAFLWFIL